MSISGRVAGLAKPRLRNRILICCRRLCCLRQAYQDPKAPSAPLHKQQTSEQLQQLVTPLR